MRCVSVQDRNRAFAIEMRVRELITVAAQAAVAARIAAAAAAHPITCVSKYLAKHALLLQLRHKPCAARDVVVQDDGRFPGICAAGNRHVQVRIRYVQSLRSA